MTISQGSESVLAATAINLAESIVDPPPTASIKSMSFSFAIFTPSRTLSILGLGTIPGS